MKKSILIALIIFWISSKPLHASGVFATPPETQIILSETRALIIHDGTHETLYLSPTFTFNPLLIKNFAWITAVPNKPQVEVIDQEIFINLELLTQKTLNKNNFFEKFINFDRIIQDYYPQPSYTRFTNLMSATSYAPDEYHKLQEFLDIHGYLLPKTAALEIEKYRSQNYYLVLTDINGYHIHQNANEEFTLTGAHALPVKISFASESIFMPLKLASIQPDSDSQVLGFSTQYQTSSTQILDDPNTTVDTMLAQISNNRFPRIPTNLNPVMIDITIVADEQYRHNVLNSVFASEISADTTIDISTKIEQKNINLPKNKKITRLIGHQAQQQLDDLYLDKTTYQIINAKLNTQEKLFRISSICVLTALGAIFLIKKIIHRQIQPQSQ